MSTTLSRFLRATLLGAVLTASVTWVPTTLLADDRTYHDKAHNDEHHWDSHEDRAYRMWVKENHRKYRDFARLKAEEQERYWAWRHEHSDAVLKIEIH